MRIKKGEKIYFGIVGAVFISLTIWLFVFREKGFEVYVNGQKETLSKTKSFMLYILWQAIAALGFGVCLRIWAGLFFRSDDFTCKYCHKLFGKSFETRKNVCKTCYEKRNIKK